MCRMQPTLILVEDTHEKAVPDLFANTCLACRDDKRVLDGSLVLDTNVQGVK